jgi:5,10-methylenetetrahydromethanopterin reductase
VIEEVAMKEPSFGISIEPTWSQSYCLKLAMRAEKLGFSNVWVPDGGPSPPFSDTVVTLAAIASNTRRIKFGSAILNFYTRNPAQIGSSFLTLSDLGFSGSKLQRAILGIGLGSNYNVSKFGIFSRKGMIEDLREAIESIQQLFKGEEVSIRTDPFVIERVKLSKSKGKIPIYVGSASPKGLRLAGELSDGIILTERIASEIQEKLKHVELGLAYSSRKRKNLEIVNSIVISVAGDKKKAEDAARITCGYLAAWLDEGVALKYGIDEEKRKEIASRINSGDEKGAAKLVDQRMLDLLTVSGTTNECIEKCNEHLNQGVDQIAFCEPLGPSKEEAISLIAKKIIPRL